MTMALRAMRDGAPSHIAKRVAAQVAERPERAHAAGELARQMARIERGIIDNQAAAKRAIDGLVAEREKFAQQRAAITKLFSPDKDGRIS